MSDRTYGGYTPSEIRAMLGTSAQTQSGTMISPSLPVEVMTDLLGHIADLTTELAAREHLDYEAQQGDDLVNAELAELRAEVTQLREYKKRAGQMLREAHFRASGESLANAMLEAQAKRVEQMQAALEWYADSTSYAVTQMTEPRSAVHADKGRRARRAIAGQDPSEE